MDDRILPRDGGAAGRRIWCWGGVGGDGGCFVLRRAMLMGDRKRADCRRRCSTSAADSLTQERFFVAAGRAFATTVLDRVSVWTISRSCRRLRVRKRGTAESYGHRTSRFRASWKLRRQSGGSGWECKYKGPAVDSVLRNCCGLGFSRMCFRQLRPGRARRRKLAGADLISHIVHLPLGFCLHGGRKRFMRAVWRMRGRRRAGACVLIQFHSKRVCIFGRWSVGNGVAERKRGGGGGGGWQNGSQRSDSTKDT